MGEHGILREPIRATLLLAEAFAQGSDPALHAPQIGTAIIGRHSLVGNSDAQGRIMKRIAVRSSP